jgi:hypothetical protein
VDDKTAVRISTFKGQVVARLTTSIACLWTIILCLVDQSNRVRVFRIRVNPPWLDVWVFPESTFWMSIEVAFLTTVEPELWVSIFFTNYTGRLVVICIDIGEEERMVIILVSCFVWQCSTFHTQLEIANHTFKKHLRFFTDTTATAMGNILSVRCKQRGRPATSNITATENILSVRWKIKGMLMTSMFKRIFQ